MTNATKLTLKKADAKELQFLIDCEMAAYAIRLTGHDTDYTATPDARGNYPRKHFLGAIDKIVERSLIGAMGVLQQRLDQGYKIFLSNICTPEVTAVGAGILYVSKPESVQAENAKKIAEEITAKYNADIEVHNQKVYAQEAAALKAEEAAIVAQLKAEDEARAAQEFDKRVQARMRGTKTK
ncbi:hypothetical protein [Pseudomonas mandelii]|uniref:Uncharacterized protein n=1 Tax=Pseudomonas mandelii TaxID=75612 RepID=A0A502IIU0_9PSED|nr:hypothetical protein [Pseudomonas mandelii]TPG85120.1 hypothetical protein EAH74_07445 [Pseudomonas mandelii]